jgi:uroporphyrin-III C-methyltransferase/precorrin-2 dehydrogenase/sirohydrochlorin ferrochelatase
LLTLRAVQALQAADVILFDDLVTPAVLDLAGRAARRISVGKRGGGGSCRQDDINALMVAFAHSGKHVVRLKSGDPMLFGRAGEELAALEAAGVPFDVVPGITAASALASRLCLSLTHRDFAQSVRLVTGHSRDGGLPEGLDWHGLADPRTTLLVYMAGHTGPAFARRLISHGLGPATPVVVAESIAQHDERITALVLHELASGGPAIGRGPVLIGIGHAFGDGGRLDSWTPADATSDRLSAERRAFASTAAATSAPPPTTPPAQRNLQ